MVVDCRICAATPDGNGPLGVILVRGTERQQGPRA